MFRKLSIIAVTEEGVERSGGSNDGLHELAESGNSLSTRSLTTSVSATS